MIFVVAQRSIRILFFCIALVSFISSVYASDSVASSVNEDFWQQLKDEKKAVTLIEHRIKSGQHLVMRDKQGSTLLHYAARLGNVALARKLLESKFNPNVFNASGETPLHEAVLGQSEELVLVLLRAGACVKIGVENCGESSWQRAVKHSKSCFFKCLIAYGRCVNFDNQQEKNAFYEAFPSLQELLWYGLELRNKRCITYALLLGANVNASKIVTIRGENHEMTPLEYTIWHDHADSALILLQHGAEINTIDFFVRDCMRQACVAKARNVIPLLIAYGACLNLKSEEERMLVREAISNELEYAVIYNKHDTIDLLAKRQKALTGYFLPTGQRNSSSAALNNIIQLNSQHALEFAVGRLNKELVRKVLHLVPHSDPTEALTIFRTMCARGDAYPETNREHKQVEILLMARVILFRTELKKAIQKVQNILLKTLPMELVLHIFNYALDPAIFSDIHYSPLYESIHIHDADLVERLLLRGFSAVNGLLSDKQLNAQRTSTIIAGAARLPFGCTPLHYAAARSLNRLKIIRLLIEYGADVNAIENASGQTPLHKACAGFAAETVKYLLRRNARITVDEQGKKPQQIANEAGAHSCAMEIEKWVIDSEIEEVEQEKLSLPERKHKKNKLVHNFIVWYCTVNLFNQSSQKSPGNNQFINEKK